MYRELGEESNRRFESMAKVMERGLEGVQRRINGEVRGRLRRK